MKHKKILIIGIDSATFDIIEPMIKEGKLPNLTGLIKAGSSGPLKSTIPPVTPPAWVSFMTGKNPGKHGVFDFYVSPPLATVQQMMHDVGYENVKVSEVISRKTSSAKEDIAHGRIFSVGEK